MSATQSARAKRRVVRRLLSLESLEGRRLLTATTDPFEPQSDFDPPALTAAALPASEPSLAELLSTGSVIIGENAPEQNFMPFGSTGGTRYQQVYSAAEFPGEVSINGLKFFHVEFFGSPGTLATGVLNFELSVTSQDVDALDTVDLDDAVGERLLGNLLVG